jgi:hypothetical protein
MVRSRTTTEVLRIVQADPESRSCFRGLATALGEHFRDEALRAGYESARDEISLLLRSQPDVPVTQDSLAGFLNGFLLAGAQFATPDLIQRKNDAMFPVMGGIHLLGSDAPLSCPPEQLTVLRSGFFQRLGGTLDDELLPQPAGIEEVYAAASEQIRRIFGTTPDVPVNRESLAGFVLGLMYCHRYVPAVDGGGLTALLVAAYLLADRSDFEPVQVDGPGLW